MLILLFIILNILIYFVDLSFMPKLYINIYYMVVFLEIYFFITYRMFYLKKRRYLFLLSALIGFVLAQLARKDFIVIEKGMIKGLIVILGVNILIIILLEYMDYKKEKIK